jgi:very-short-patch-repair endonuclease
MNKFKCENCGQEFDSLDSLRRHNVQKHNISSEETYLKYVLSGEAPTCKCGCGEKTKFLSLQKGFSDFILGHASRINNNWGHNPKAQKKSKETQNKMFKDGKLKIWNKGLTIEDERVKKNTERTQSNPNRGKNISKSLKGVKKSDKHKKRIKEISKKRWANPEERKKQSERTIKRLLKKNYRNPKTDLEKNFQTILESLGFVENVDFKYQYQVGLAIFDFFFYEKNILIEVDGDFHHCNPNSKHCIPVHPIQMKTVANDIRKNRIAETENYKLIRVWETDINTKRDEVINRLKKELEV